MFCQCKMASARERTCLLVLGITCGLFGLFLTETRRNADTNFLIGAGIGDITGPAAEVNLVNIVICNVNILLSLTRVLSESCQ